MAITQAMTTSFKAQLLLAVHDFRPSADTGADVFKLALYTSAATLDANTTTYSASNEASGSNYTAGGLALTNTGVTATNIKMQLTMAVSASKYWQLLQGTKLTALMTSHQARTLVLETLLTMHNCIRITRSTKS